MGVKIRMCADAGAVIYLPGAVVLSNLDDAHCRHLQILASRRSNTARDSLQVLRYHRTGRNHHNCETIMTSLQSLLRRCEKATNRFDVRSKTSLANCILKSSKSKSTRFGPRNIAITGSLLMSILTEDAPFREHVRHRPARIASLSVCRF